MTHANEIIVKNVNISIDSDALTCKLLTLLNLSAIIRLYPTQYYYRERIAVIWMAQCRQPTTHAAQLSNSSSLQRGIRSFNLRRQRPRRRSRINYLLNH